MIPTDVAYPTGYCYPPATVDPTAYFHAGNASSRRFSSKLFPSRKCRFSRLLLRAGRSGISCPSTVIAVEFFALDGRILFERSFAGIGTPRGRAAGLRRFPLRAALSARAGPSQRLSHNEEQGPPHSILATRAAGTEHLEIAENNTAMSLDRVFLPTSITIRTTLSGFSTRFAPNSPMVTR